MSEDQHVLLVDYDFSQPLLMSQNLLYETGMDLVRLDARRLAKLVGPVKLKRAGGVHLYSCRAMPWKDVEALMCYSLGERGHVGWSVTHGEAGLRISRKNAGRRMVGEDPYLMELVVP